MNNILRPTVLGLLTWGCCMAAAQEQIPEAVPVEDGNAPLQTRPGEDKLKIADLLFQQAQGSKDNPTEYIRLMGLTAERYAEYIRDNPNAAETPLAMYRMATCLMDAGKSAEAYQTLGTIVQHYKGDVAAAAAYRLATEAYRNSDWANAQRFYLVTIEQTTKPELKTDATYRLARVNLSQQRPDQAAVLFRSIISSRDAQPVFRQASMQALAAMQASAGKHAEAYELYKKLLQEPNLDSKTRSSAILEAATLASLLNKEQEAQSYYDQIINNPDLAGKTAEAQLGMLLALYKQKKYADLIKFYEQGQIESDDKELNAKRRFIVGQAAYQMKDYDRARTLFTLAERSNPHTELAMEAAYRRLLAQNELKDPELVNSGQIFLNTYAKAFPTSKWPDMVRLLMAERLFQTNPGQAAAFYEAINLDKIDKKLKPDILYLDAWACGKAGNRERAIALLDQFMKDYPKDSRLPNAMAFRGSMNVQTGREADALRDFEEVIKNWPRHDAAALAWQMTAQLYDRKQDTLNMIKAYEGLIKNFPKTMPIAIADARFKIGMGYLERKEYAKAIPNFEEARALNPEKYADQVDRRLVQTYYQLEDATRLKNALETMRQKDPKSLEGVPDAITAWLGMNAFAAKDYAIADRYLTLATRNNELKQVKRIIWKNLAKARIALKRYETALVAVDFYLGEEKQPIGKVEGQLDKAIILLGLRQYDEARKLAETALASGVEGPLMASLKIALGDIAFAEKKYDEAAKHYGTTAELFVSDQQLKPEALYKAHASLAKAGRVAEAAQYKTLLDKEFPGWKPSETQELPPDGR